MRLQALSMAASQGHAQAAAATEVSITELVKPSIFDTDEMKNVKSMMMEVQEYIAEIEYMAANKEKLEKERAEAQQ